MHVINMQETLHTAGAAIYTRYAGATHKAIKWSSAAQRVGAYITWSPVGLYRGKLPSHKAMRKYAHYTAHDRAVLMHNAYILQYTAGAGMDLMQRAVYGAVSPVDAGIYVAQMRHAVIMRRDEYAHTLHGVCDTRPLYELCDTLTALLNDVDYMKGGY